MQTAINWAELDALCNFEYLEDFQEIIHKLGFTYISEAIIKLYQEHQSTRKTGHLLGRTDTTIARFLKKFNVPIRKQGGAAPGRSTFETWQRPFYDGTLYYNGRLCLNGHDWNQTRRSLRLKTTHTCIMCAHTYNQIHYRNKQQPFTGTKGRDTDGSSPIFREIIRK
jgi:hypothetical protein